MIGPIRPWPVSDEMVSNEIPSSKPLANVTFVVQNDRGTVASFTTDGQGRFRISLNPGHYTVTRDGTKVGIGRYGPFDVDVVVGQMTKVEWQCDTGIR
jgi:Carboxypeptidase regulatory-like domain